MAILGPSLGFSTLLLIIFSYTYVSDKMEKGEIMYMLAAPIYKTTTQDSNLTKCFLLLP